MAYDPRGMNIERWSALTASLLTPYGYVPVSTTEDDWQSWATSAKNIPILAPRFVPSPKGFGDWRAWAFRLNEALHSLGL
jgi:hypothetical protein